LQEKGVRGIGPSMALFQFGFLLVPKIAAYDAIFGTSRKG